MTISIYFMTIMDGVFNLGVPFVSKTCLHDERCTFNSLCDFLIKFALYYVFRIEEGI